MADHIEQIKSRLDIVDVISGYLKVQKSGMNFKARCPFHNEKTPSFYISPERQIWHCFGCSKGGDMFGFIKEIEGVEFPEALRILAHRAGIELEKFDPAIRNAKTRLYEICELASKFFEKQLQESATGKKALAYLKERGMNEATVREWRLGFAPNDWQALGKFLSDCGYDDKEIVDAGMAVKKDNRHYDRFRSRITFPISDVNGQVVGFTARIFVSENSDKQPTTDNRQQAVEGAKYINSPQTLIYDKSRVLYGLAKSKTEIKQAGKCLLVEGNMDAIMSHQAGVKNVVATSGTALTQSQLKLLARYSNDLNFCFDADQAGAMATRRGIGLALSQNFSVKVVKIEDAECKDPADYVKKYGAGWVQAAEKAKPVIEFYFDKAKEGYDPVSAESKKSVIAAVAPLINRLTSQVERSHWVSHLASFLRAGDDAVRADIASARDDLEAYETYNPQPTASDSGVPVKSGELSVVGRESVDMLSDALLSVVMKDIPMFKEELRRINLEFVDPSVADVLAKLAMLAQNSEMTGDAEAKRIIIDTIIKNADQDGQYRLEFAYIKSQELWKDFDEKDLKTEFHILLQKLQRKDIMSRLAGLEFDIKEAEAKRDAERITSLVRSFDSLAKELAAIQKV